MSGHGTAAPHVDPASVKLTPQSLDRIDREIAKYPPEQRQSAVIAALAIAQAQVGWLPAPVMEEVAQVLAMPPIAVYEVASFYHLFHLKPVGRHTIRLCTNLPCALSGANQAGEHLKQKLGIDYGETSADGSCTLVEGECLGACGDAPVLTVDNASMHGLMTDDKLDVLLERLRKEGI